MFRSFQIIFRELVGSLLKSLNLKFLKIVKVICGDAAVCVVCVRGARCGEVCWTAVYIIILTF